MTCAKSEEDILPCDSGAESIFNAASHGVKRVVFTGSIVAVGTSTDPTDIAMSRGGMSINLYYRADGK